VEAIKAGKNFKGELLNNKYLPAHTADATKIIKIRASTVADFMSL